MHDKTFPETTDTPSAYGLAHAIRHHALVTPDKTALVDSETTLSYTQLEDFSNRFAHWLHENGCGLRDRVIILANRRAFLVAAIVGTFKSGCVHVPLDPQMPAGRLGYILQDVAPALVITEAELVPVVREHLDESVKVVETSEIEQLLADTLAGGSGKSIADGLPDIHLDDPAYCIYTSGSTGRPKGVVINHESIAPFFDGSREVYNVRKSSICASFSPMHFDVYLMDMLFPLAEGAKLYVYDDVVVPDLMFEVIQSNNVTHFSAWGMMLGLIAQAEEFNDAPLPEMRTILTGTAIPDIKTVQRWLGKGKGMRVINAYGPTEVTCASTAHCIEELEPDRQELYPIGKPLKHVLSRLEDDQGNVVEGVGARGELLVGGPQVMQEYWNRPDESQKSLTARDGVKFYRTGDICSYLPDNVLFYHGRRDNEVNLGGRRVHLNEVQRVICGVPGVHSAEIVTFMSAYDEQILAAAVLLDGGRSTNFDKDIDQIKKKLDSELPAYMVPRHIDVFGAFPQLSSGKPDRGAILGQLDAKYGKREEVIT